MSEFLETGPDKGTILSRVMDMRIVQFIFNRDREPMLEVHVPSGEANVTEVLFPAAATPEDVEAQRAELIDYIAD